MKIEAVKIEAVESVEQCENTILWRYEDIWRISTYLYLFLLDVSLLFRSSSNLQLSFQYLFRYRNLKLFKSQSKWIMTYWLNYSDKSHLSSKNIAITICVWHNKHYFWFFHIYFDIDHHSTWSFSRLSICIRNESWHKN